MAREQFDGDFFDIEDLGIIDADGYLSLTGRTKDIIVCGGENIPVAYVENVLYEHPDLEALAVVASPHERLQKIAALVVVMRPGAEPLTLEAMQEYLREKALPSTTGAKRWLWQSSCRARRREKPEIPVAQTTSWDARRGELREDIMTQSQRVLRIGTGGIGSAIARRFAADQRKIFATYHSNPASIEALTDELGSETVVGSGAVEVTDRDSIERVCGEGGTAEDALGSRWIPS